MPQRRALTIELAAQRWWCLLRYCRFLCDRPVTVTAAKCRDAGKIDYHHGVQIKQTALSGDCVQSRLHPRVGLDSQPGRCGRSCIPQVYPTHPAGSTALVMVMSPGPQTRDGSVAVASVDHRLAAAFAR